MIEIDKLLLSLAIEKPKLTNPINRINLAVPLIRSQLKNELSFIGLTEKEKLNYWDRVWKESKYFESMSLALYYYQHRTLTKIEFVKIKNWINRVSCWEHSDDLSKILALVVENNPEWVIPIFRKWNKSKCFWKRRQSIVGLIEYSSKRKKVLSFKELISFINPLLYDDEYYVQKAIGWTLREIFNVYPKQTKKYFDDNLSDISSIAYTAATQKLDKETKKKMNELRKMSRILKEPLK